MKGHLFTISAHGRRPRELSGVHFIRVLILFMGALLLRPKHLPKSMLLNTITLRIRFEHMNLGGHTNIQSITIPNIYPRSPLGPGLWDLGKAQ